MKNAMIATALTLLLTTSAHAYDLNVPAAAQNQVASGTMSYTIPQGTKAVTVLYNVYSAEYPAYVTIQSVYNDVWSVSLTGSGGVLFSITRQVNSQLTQEPTWLPDSTTGDIRETIDVSALTGGGEAVVQLVGTAMNVGDDVFPTIVSASIEPPPLLSISIADPDIIDSHNDGTYYSVPATGDSNALQRTFTLTVTKGKTVTLEHMTVTLRGTADLMDVVQHLSVPSANGVEVLAQSETTVSLRVRVTVQTPSSTVNGVPPPTRNLSYKFHLQGQDDKGQVATAEKIVTGRRALWRTAGILPSRYSTRDDGHDDWAARGTYLWLQEHSDLINAVNDISGEHGRDLVHDTHARGTDIDTYHFYRFENNVSGTQNYLLLRDAMVTAFGTILPNGNPNPNPPAPAINARANVIAFVNATRVGIDNLFALESVAQLRYMLGSAGQTLPNGWARSLLRTGTVTRRVNGVDQTLDLGLGAWCSEAPCNTGLVHVPDHDNHLHIDLNDAMIGE